MRSCVKLAGNTRCLSVLKTSKSLENPAVIQEHNHPDDIDVRVVAKCRQEMTLKSHNTTNRTNRILTFRMANITDEAKPRVPRPDTAEFRKGWNMLDPSRSPTHRIPRLDSRLWIIPRLRFRSCLPSFCHGSEPYTR